jgi:hypothetical protein
MKTEDQSSRSGTRDIGMAPIRSLREFEGASAIVTGGASGIGRALGEQLASRGSTVCLVDRQIDMAEEAAAEIRAGGGKATASDVDVSDYAAVEQVVREMLSRTGRLDYMFNNAGIAVGGAFSLNSIDDWTRIVDVNLLGVINGVQAAYQVMLKQGFGHIVKRQRSVPWCDSYADSARRRQIRQKLYEYIAGARAPYVGQASTNVS